MGKHTTIGEDLKLTVAHLANVKDITEEEAAMCLMRDLRTLYFPGLRVVLVAEDPRGRSHTTTQP